MADTGPPSILEKAFIAGLGKIQEVGTNLWRRYSTFQNQRKDTILGKVLGSKRALGVAVGILYVGYYLKSQRDKKQRQKHHSNGTDSKVIFITPLPQMKVTDIHVFWLFFSMFQFIDTHIEL